LYVNGEFFLFYIGADAQADEIAVLFTTVGLANIFYIFCTEICKYTMQELILTIGMTGTYVYEHIWRCQMSAPGGRLGDQNFDGM
jgi:hypothetical protein